jgi:serine/threonine-protein kinase
VWLAKQLGPAGFEKDCVIKRILPQLALDQQFVQMFLDEARIAARLSHPNIVQIFDFGEVGNHDYFIAMEYVQGVDLSHLLDIEHNRGGNMPLAIALRIVCNVAEALEAAHRATDGRGQPLGIVHRDVTPSNVMVSFDGVAKLCDFGIAKASSKGGRTEVGVIKGKMPYMSPEQVGGTPVDARSDLFSLGTLIYELTVGNKPFDGTSPGEISIKVLHDDPVPPSLAVPNYPEPLSNIVWRLLSKDPGERFASAREVHIAIEEFLVSSGIRSTSAEVAAYLDELLPGKREELHAEAARGMPVDVTDPTMPMHVTRDGIIAVGAELPPEQSGPSFRGDLSQPLEAVDDVGRNLGGRGGGGMIYVAILLIAGVAAGFWYLRTHMKPEPPAIAAPATTPSPAPTATPTAAPTPELPKPAVAPTAAPAPEPPKPVEPPKPAPAPKPAVAAKPKPAHKPPQQHAPKSTPGRSLPHLPSPPPPDNGD